MRVCILGSGLSALTLAKALVGQNIFVDIFSSKKKPALNFSRTLGISKSNLDYFNNNLLFLSLICYTKPKFLKQIINYLLETYLNSTNNKGWLIILVKSKTFSQPQRFYG